MPDLTIVQIDAFAEALFEGNPAAVVPLEAWLPDALMQQVALENNLSETAFLVRDEGAGAELVHPAYHLRWFTPAIEVDLCGHATLATASYLFEDVHPDATRLRFATRSGWLYVERAGDGRGYTMDFPSQPPTPTAVDPAVVDALRLREAGVEVLEAFGGVDLTYLVAGADAVAAVEPDFSATAKLDTRGVIVTALGVDRDGRETGFDFVSRFFGARAGIAEDPVTGSAHSQIAPLWAQRLGRTTLLARQVSARGGTVRCRVAGERTYLTGTCRRYLTGRITLPNG